VELAKDLSIPIDSFTNIRPPLYRLNSFVYKIIYPSHLSSFLFIHFLHSSLFSSRLLRSRSFKCRPLKYDAAAENFETPTNAPPEYADYALEPFSSACNLWHYEIQGVIPDDLKEGYERKCGRKTNSFSDLENIHFIISRLLFKIDRISRFSLRHCKCQNASYELYRITI